MSQTHTLIDGGKPGIENGKPAVPREVAGGVQRIEVEAVNSAPKRELYKARAPIYPKLVHGTYRLVKWALLFATLGVYYALPWLRWTRGPGEPDQAVLVDFPGQRFYFFAIEIWPDELYFVTGLLILGALALFLATALFGRVWCGYTCPQTVWTDLFIAVERLVEGDRNKRMRLAKAPWNAEKIGKKFTKHSLWVLIAALTGGAWVFYFHDAPTILPQMLLGQAPLTAYLFMGILTFTTYTFAGVMREQVCIYMCPWPRIQAALTDEESLQVTYKFDRGEPRGAHKKGESWDDRGDCISCRACVAACPMGIDIRDGIQLECINCALCIDACDDIMKKIGRPRGLIDYDTDKNEIRRERGEKSSVRLIRPRTIVYTLVLGLIAAIMAYGLSSRATMELNVLRDRTPPYVQLSDGSIRNAYTVKILNKANDARGLVLTIDAPEGALIKAIGEEVTGGEIHLTPESDSVHVLRLFVTLPKTLITKSSIPVMIMITDPASGEEAVNPTVFLSGDK